MSMRLVMTTVRTNNTVTITAGIAVQTISMRRSPLVCDASFSGRPFPVRITYTRMTHTVMSTPARIPKIHVASVTISLPAEPSERRMSGDWQPPRTRAASPTAAATAMTAPHDLRRSCLTLPGTPPPRPVPPLRHCAPIIPRIAADAAMTAAGGPTRGQLKVRRTLEWRPWTTSGRPSRASSRSSSSPCWPRCCSAAVRPPGACCWSWRRPRSPSAARRCSTTSWSATWTGAWSARAGAPRPPAASRRRAPRSPALPGWPPGPRPCGPSPAASPRSSRCSAPSTTRSSTRCCSSRAPRSAPCPAGWPASSPPSSAGPRPARPGRARSSGSACSSRSGRRRTRGRSPWPSATTTAPRASPRRPRAMASGPPAA